MSFSIRSKKFLSQHPSLALFCFTAFCLGVLPDLTAQIQINIGPHRGPAGPPYGTGTGFGNFLQITNVQYRLNGGSPFTPGNTGAPTGFTNPTHFNPGSGRFIGSDANRYNLATGDSLIIYTVAIDTNGSAPGGILLLEKFSPGTITVANYNFNMNVAWSQLSNVYASNSGVRTDVAIQNMSGPPHTPNNPAWLTAAANIIGTTDLNDLLVDDSRTSFPSYDYDVRFTTPLTIDDFILVSERNGNSVFTLTPLNASYAPITNANTLAFGGPFGDGSHAAYDFRTGVIPAGTAGQNQDHGLTVAATSLFFNSALGGPSTAAAQPVYGFRVNNSGQADVNFFGLSAVPIPEGNSVAVAVIAGAIVLGSACRNFLKKKKAAI